MYNTLVYVYLLYVFILLDIIHIQQCISVDCRQYYKFTHSRKFVFNVRVIYAGNTLIIISKEIKAS